LLAGLVLCSPAFVLAGLTLLEALRVFRSRQSWNREGLYA
jgi:hypothetical protein